MIQDALPCQQPYKIPVTRKLISAQLIVIIATLVLCDQSTWADDDDDTARPTRSRVGESIIVIDQVAQSAAGIKTQTASDKIVQTEYTAVGKVLEIGPMLAMRERYLVAMADKKAAQARLAQAEQSFNRQQELFRNGVSAKRSIQEQQAQVLADHATVDAVEVRLAGIAGETRLQWGQKLADKLLTAPANAISDLISGRRFIVQITLPPGRQREEKNTLAWIDANGQRETASAAEWISRAPSIDSSAQGQSYFYQVQSDNLRAGMKITAWLPEGNAEKSGVVVPTSALLWYLDQAYVYIKGDGNTFNRRPIKSFKQVPDGYFIVDGLTSGEEFVSIGGQVLLSEEMRGQIPDEDKD